MTRAKKSIATVILSGAVGACLGGSSLLLNPAWAANKSNSQQVGTANDMADVFRNVGKTVSPSVVNIQVRKTIKAPAGQDNEGLRRFFQDNPFFKDHPEFQLPQMPDENGGSYEQVGTGSGVVMEVDGNTGYILTNNHVAGGASEMVVTLSDGRKIENAKLVGADPKSDLAVVKITADHLTPAKWGDASKLQQGDWIMAFGSPFGYIGSMTHGIVSALDRSNVGILGANGYEDFIQVDAPINPGNSGGPLVNLEGEVVGINTAIASRTGSFSGIGFAIPSTEAHSVYNSLKEHGKVVRGWMGVSIGDVSQNPKLAQSFGYKNDKGVLVESALPNSPATGKLQPGDIIENINGKQVENVTQLRNQIAEMAPDTEVKLDVFREGKEVPVSFKLGTQPANLSMAANEPGGSAQGENTENSLGATLADVDEQMVQKFNLGQAHQGALVTHVKPGSPADIAGLRPGDLITQVGNTHVKDASEAANLLNKQDLKNGVRLYVTGPQGAHYIFVQAQAQGHEQGQ